jgi:hypothetical protein
VLHVSKLLQHPFYRSANLYARLLSADGTRITSALGFTPVSGSRDSGLTRYVRLANRGVAAARQHSEADATLPRAA